MWQFEALGFIVDLKELLLYYCLQLQKDRLKGRGWETILVQVCAAD